MLSGKNTMEFSGKPFFAFGLGRK